MWPGRSLSMDKCPDCGAVFPRHLRHQQTCTRCWEGQLLKPAGDGVFHYNSEYPSSATVETMLSCTLCGREFSYDMDWVGMGVHYDTKIEMI